MDTLLLVLLVAAAALACPTMMWWQRRQGRDPACAFSPGRSERRDDATDLNELRLRHERLAAEISELDANVDREATSGPR